MSACTQLADLAKLTGSRSCASPVSADRIKNQADFLMYYLECTLIKTEGTASLANLSPAGSVLAESTSLQSTDEASAKQGERGCLTVKDTIEQLPCISVANTFTAAHADVIPHFYKCAIGTV
jgi:hypothetical protein